MKKLLVICLLLLCVDITVVNKKQNTEKIIDDVTYYPKGKWGKVCWVKALKYLERAYWDKNVIGAAMIYGDRLPCKNNDKHAWVEFLFKNGNVVYYDPGSNVNITDHQKDEVPDSIIVKAKDNSDKGNEHLYWTDKTDNFITDITYVNTAWQYTAPDNIWDDWMEEHKTAQIGNVYGLVIRNIVREDGKTVIDFNFERIK